MGHFTDYVSHPDPIDVSEPWGGLSHALERRVLVVPIPKPVLSAAMKLATLASRVVGFTNQLDMKQYRQMVAPAFLCSSEALRTDLGWEPRHELDDCLAHAAVGYRRSGLLSG